MNTSDERLQIMIAVDGSEISETAATTAAGFFGPDADYCVVSVGSYRPYLHGGLATGPSHYLLVGENAPDPELMSEHAAGRAADAVEGEDVDEVETIASGRPAPRSWGWRSETERTCSSSVGTTAGGSLD